MGLFNGIWKEASGMTSVKQALFRTRHSRVVDIKFVEKTAFKKFEVIWFA